MGMFLLVVFGIELDMMGFFASVSDYMSYGNDLLIFFLVLGVLSFILPLLIHTCKKPAASGSEDEEQPGGLSPADAKNTETFIAGLIDGNRIPDPIGGTLEWYHFIPMCRFYLLLRGQIDTTDADAVFRINSLSSFSLGVFQCLGIMFTYADGHEVNLKIKMNMASQVLNWTITVLYFVSPICAWMGRAAEVKRTSRYYQGLMNAWSHDLSLSAGLTFKADAERDAAEKSRADRKAKIMMDVGSAFGEELPESLTVRDGDVRFFIELLRDQAIAAVEMNKAM